MAKYAAETKVAQTKSVQDIERVLARYGSEAFAFGRTPEQVAVQFKFNGRPFQISVVMPNPKDPEFVFIGGNSWDRKRSDGPKAKMVEQAGRQRLRALLLFVKASCEAVDSELMTFEQAFLPHLLVSDGVTVSDRLLPEIKLIHESGKLPKLLPGG